MPLSLAAFWKLWKSASRTSCNLSACHADPETKNACPGCNETGTDRRICGRMGVRPLGPQRTFHSTRAEPAHTEAFSLHPTLCTVSCSDLFVGMKTTLWLLSKVKHLAWSSDNDKVWYDTFASAFVAHWSAITFPSGRISVARTTRSDWFCRRNGIWKAFSWGHQK